jgi:hypothetical protein
MDPDDSTRNDRKMICPDIQEMWKVKANRPEKEKTHER